MVILISNPNIRFSSLQATQCSDTICSDLAFLKLAKIPVLLCQSLDRIASTTVQDVISCKCIRYPLHRRSRKINITSCIAQGQHITKFSSEKHIIAWSLIIFMCHRQTCWLQTRNLQRSLLIVKRTCNGKSVAAKNWSEPFEWIWQMILVDS